jgi:hypothetical protein
MPRSLPIDGMVGDPRTLAGSGVTIALDGMVGDPRTLAGSGVTIALVSVG